MTPPGGSSGQWVRRWSVQSAAGDRIPARVGVIKMSHPPGTSVDLKFSSVQVAKSVV